ncbi:hypothetical protein OG535_38285 [Kitasatospora sp. NBC_00085]
MRAYPAIAGHDVIGGLRTVVPVAAAIARDEHLDTVERGGADG